MALSNRAVMSILFYCFSAIYAILILNWTISYYYLRQHPCLAKRQPNAVILYGAIMALYIAFDRTAINLLNNTPDCNCSFPHWLVPPLSHAPFSSPLCYVQSQYILYPRTHPWPTNTWESRRRIHW